MIYTYRCQSFIASCPEGTVDIVPMWPKNRIQDGANFARKRLDSPRPRVGLQKADSRFGTMVFEYILHLLPPKINVCHAPAWDKQKCYTDAIKVYPA